MTKAAELAKMGEVLTSSQIGGRRNIIINGAMQVAQRGTSSTDSNTYGTVDRLDSRINGQDNAVTQAQVDVSSGTTPYSLGFRKAFKYTNGNQSSGAGATDYLFAFYKIEAQDIVNSGWDYTSSSSHITISFWVKASVSQNYYGYLRTPDGTAQKHSFETGTLTADTWTKVTKTFSGNSNITIDNDTGSGLVWYLAPFLGTDYTDNSASLTAWEAYSSGYTRTPDSTSTWWTTNSATLEFTGLQLEVGEQATPFEHRSFGEELALCQRYFYRRLTDTSSQYLCDAFTTSSTQVVGQVQFPVEMRAKPATTADDLEDAQFRHEGGTNALDSFSGISGASAVYGVSIFVTTSGVTSGKTGFLRHGGESDAPALNFDSEL
tara:strand:+ start:1277 stop:2407 length:1131 start_codon:yes stop_codon:yes gene_type:complete